jgi:hypothetical protein
MPAAIFNGANVKILKDILKGKSGWRLVGTGLTYDYTLPTISGGETLVSQGTPTFTTYFQVKNNASPGGTDTPATANDNFLYMKPGADSTIGQYDSLYFKDSGNVEHEIDPSLGRSSLIRTNAQSVDHDITIPGTTNGMSAGPITISTGITVTVTGNWSIV